jgi:hypothetical protein
MLFVLPGAGFGAGPGLGAGDGLGEAGVVLYCCHDCNDVIPCTFEVIGKEFPIIFLFGLSFIFYNLKS